MSDEKENQTAEPDKNGEKAAAEPEKAAAAAPENAAEPQKAEAPEDKPAAGEAGKASAAKASGPKPPRSQKEKVLIACLAVAVVGLVCAVMYFFTVLNQARNPLAQTPGGNAPSEAELEKDEAQFAPKTPVSIPQDSAVMHEKPAAAAKNPPAKGAKSKAGK